MRLHTFISAVLILGGCSVFVVAQASPDQVAIYALVRDGKCAEAIVKIDDILEQSPRKLEFLIVKAECLVEMGQKMPARESALAALQEPGIARESFFRAFTILFRLKEHEEALRIASDFIDQKRFLFEAYNRRSAIYTALGKYELGIEDMITAARTFPGEAPLNGSSVTGLAQIPAADPLRARLYRKVFEELKPLHDQAVTLRDSLLPGEFYSPKMMNAVHNMRNPLMIAVYEEMEMFDSRGMTAETEEALDRMVTLDPRSYAYRLRAAFYEKRDSTIKHQKLLGR